MALLRSLALGLLLTSLVFAQEKSSCYDKENKPIRCTPPFVNAAYGLQVSGHHFTESFLLRRGGGTRGTHAYSMFD